MKIQVRKSLTLFMKNVHIKCLHGIGGEEFFISELESR